MNAIPNDRLEEARRKLREVLTLEEIRKIPKYRTFTVEQYTEYIDNIEKFCFLILDSYLSTNKGRL
jgi:hypothetical protein